jgi:dCMP deaminase
LCKKRAVSNATTVGIRRVNFMKSFDRIPWDKFWFTLAMVYSTRGTCDRLRVSCLIVKNKRLVSAGYNGSVSGLPHCDEVGHLIIDNHCERTIHSEINAILNAPRESLVGAVAYITAAPCLRCAKALVAAGVKEVRYLDTYENSRGRSYLGTLSARTRVPFVSCEHKPIDLFDSTFKRLRSKGGIMHES